MKIKHFIIILITFSSCKDDIHNKKYRNENFVFYQENGKKGEWLKIDPQLKIKLPKSHSTYFFPNGNRYAELEVIDSFPNRILKFFNKKDKLMRTCKYRSDSIESEFYENGYYTQYHSNVGLIQSEGLIENNMSQGKWKFYRKDGSLKQIVHYVNDTLMGMRKDYWKNGNLESSVNITNGIHNGKALHYYENGNLKELNTLKNGEFHGPMIKYYQNGNVESARTYWKGKLIDTCKSYYESGQLKLLQFFDLDTVTMSKSGIEINYYPNGNLNAKASFNGNKSNITIYHENGTIQEVSEKINGKHHGNVTVYHENGYKKLEGIAKSGYYNGSFKFYNKYGRLIKTVNYDLGQPIDSIIH